MLQDGLAKKYVSHDRVDTIRSTVDWKRSTRQKRFR